MEIKNLCSLSVGSLGQASTVTIVDVVLPLTEEDELAHSEAYASYVAIPHIVRPPSGNVALKFQSKAKKVRALAVLR